MTTGPASLSSGASSSSSSSSRAHAPASASLAALPPGHFLSLPPTFATDSSTTTTSHASRLAPNVASLAAADYDVDVRTGFLPAAPNAARLPAAYAAWEDALDAASGDGPGEGLRLGGGPREARWRAAVGALPVLPTTGLGSLPLLRRAHAVLAFLLHFYVHSAEAAPSTSAAAAPAPAVPASIAVPLTAVSAALGLPPILTYADTVLYNYAPAAAGALTSTANLPSTTLATFTHTRSEANFYLVSAECEIVGAAALRLMRQSLDELFLGDELALRRLTAYLGQLATMIDRIGDVILKTLTMVDPEEFYHLIRPWFKGGDGAGPDAPGWIFEGISDDVLGAAAAAENTLGAAGGAGRKFSGPSAGQSSLVHAIDIFLTVDHAERPDEAAPADAAPASIRLASDPVSAPATDAGPSSSLAAAAPRPAVEATFLQRMLQYMPAQHRAFLTHLSTHPTPLRPLVVARAQTHPALAAAYDGALAALGRFRDKHMRVVSLFVVQQARRQPSDRIRRMLGQTDADADAAAAARGGRDVRAAEDAALQTVDLDAIRGTGGTPLVRFLKRCRENTTRAMVGAAAQ